MWPKEVLMEAWRAHVDCQMVTFARIAHAPTDYGCGPMSGSITSPRLRALPSSIWYYNLTPHSDALVMVAPNATEAKVVSQGHTGHVSTLCLIGRGLRGMFTIPSF